MEALLKGTIRTREISTYSSTKLIDHIIENHHSYLYKALPELSRLTAKILRLHGCEHPELEQVYNLFNDLKIEIEQHIIQEEEIVFPMIKEYEKNPSIMQLNRLKDIFGTLEEDHVTNTEILSTIREVTNNYRVPETCSNYQLTFMKLQELEADLKEHMDLENDILLARFESKFA